MYPSLQVDLNNDTTHARDPDRALEAGNAVAIRQEQDKRKRVAG